MIDVPETKSVGLARSRPATTGRSRLRRGRHPILNSFMALSLLAAVLTVVGAVQAEPAAAELPPVMDSDADMATVDVLPTVQVNGIVWDQEVIGDTVYVVGNFSKARPAGAAPGTNEVNRSNILAYDINTGVLNNSFAPTLNNEALVITAAPDGSRLYVGGMFTNVNGTNQYRITSLDPANGQIDPAFSAVVDYRVNAIAATNDAIYVGGKFNNAQSFTNPVSPFTPRSNLAAFDRFTGSVLPWNPGADAEVLGIAVSPDFSRVFVAGKFAKVGGVTNRGTAAISASGTGALLDWPVNSQVWASGSAAAMLAIRATDDSVYFSGYHFGSGGNLEGTAAADINTGELKWVADCHGDTYDIAPDGETIYTVSHVHYCGNMGGFHQSNPWYINGRYALAFSTDAKGTNTKDIWDYPDHPGAPAPSLKAWFPQFGAGSIAGQSAWTVETTDDYVLVGGEFPNVNNVPQQGLVRFAKRSKAPRNDGPRLGGSSWPLNIQSYSAGEVRISFGANHDRDNAELTYDIIRNGDNTNPVFTTKLPSFYWDLPAIGFTDKGLTPGSTHSYIVRATDSDGNVAWSEARSVTVASSGSSSPYADAVVADNPRLYWRFNDPAGSSVARADAGNEQGSLGNKNNVAFGTAGALLNEASNTAVDFDNNLNSHVTSDYSWVVNTFTIETWIKAPATIRSGGLGGIFGGTTANSGRIMGFSNSPHGSSGTKDRMMYMNNNGSITFGAYPRSTKTITSRSGLNNDAWHHVVATMGSNGMRLYIDGVLDAMSTASDFTTGQGYYGYWRVGSDSIGNWPGTRAKDYLVGSFDEAAVYNKVLSPQQVANHYAASGRTPALPTAPSDGYGNSMHGSDPVLYYRLGESSGTTAADSGIRSTTGTYVGTVGRSATGVIPGNAAATFGGNGFVRSATSFYDPTGYSVQAWFKTGTTAGGQIIGFGNATSGSSSTSDRQVVMQNNGSLAFRSGGSTITTGASYNDDAWHHVVATQGTDGMRLYVDGSLVSSGSRSVGTVFSGYWRIGNDNTNGLSSSNAFAGTIDEVAVHDRVISGDTVLATYLTGGGQLPNIAPTAAFTTTQNFLQVGVDASGSSDPDGSIASYAWDFGDGTNGSGVTGTHTYTEGGTYTITLTVTDDDGDSASTTRDVTVAPEPPNAEPIANFTMSTNGLTVNVNGATSTDPDGSIVSYDWDFGDGTNGSGVTSNHTYGDEGTYTITLTVTDDKGATGTLSNDVSVSIPTGPVVHAVDTFSRSTTNGWGAADIGGTWSLEYRANLYGTSDGVGDQTMDVAGRTTGTFLDDVAAEDVTVTVDMTLDKPLTGGGLFNYVLVRRNGSTEYQLRVRAEVGNTSLTLFRVVNGASTAIASANVPGMILTAGETYRVSVTAAGSSPTLLSGKIWNVTGTEPVDAQVTATDGTAGLQGPGGIGLMNYLSGSTTNAPLTVSYDNLLAASGDDVEVPDIPNVAPTAAFTGSLSGRTLSVDAGDSSDPDGSIVSYGWSFGDGTTGSGVQATHTYAEPGTYVVTLIVTDDDGDADATSLTVVVADDDGPALVASDGFGRSMTNGWGSAELGGLWSFLFRASQYSVQDGAGIQTLDVAGRTLATYLGTFDERDVTATTSISIDKPLTGAGLYSYVGIRRIGTSEYTLRFRFMTDSTVMAIFRTIDGNSTALASLDLPGVVVTPGETYRISFSATGASPTELSAKFWNVADGEPLMPMLTTTDSNPTLQAAGGLSLTNYLSGSTTNAPLAVRYEDLVVTKN